MGEFAHNDRYNTTIYAMNDRHHGITRRDVVFLNERDLASRG
jgi:hypothetical protein